jgi:uncharacterized membrane protein (DUF485 family)
MSDDIPTSQTPHASSEAGPPAGNLDALLRVIMRRQARLSLGVAAIFLVLVLGLPLVNHYLQGLAQLPIAGFSATWLLLGLLFYPITWLLSAYFVHASDEVEQEIARDVKPKPR